MKKRKYGLGGDIGKYMLNNLENSALGMFGLDFYKPKFDTSITFAGKPAGTSSANTIVFLFDVNHEL